MSGLVEFSKYPIIGIDTETTGVQWWKDKMFGFSISTPDGGDYYYDIRRTPQVVDHLKQELRRSDTKLAFQNGKFDHHFLREAGAPVPEGRTVDTMIMAALLDEHRLSYGLDELGFDYLGQRKEDIWAELAAIFGGKPTKHAQIKNLPAAPFELAAKYAKRDTRLTLNLADLFLPMISAQNLDPVLDLEMKLLPVLTDLEHRGVRVDLRASERAMDDLDVIIKAKRKKLDDMAGFPINPNPSASIHKLLNPKEQRNPDGTFTLVDGTIAQATKGGKASIDAATLRAMKHPAAEAILDVRKLIKARDTFIKGHILGHHDNGIIHCNYNQTKGENDAGTGTGRISVNDPALQQIPKRDKATAAIVRALFLPDKGQVWNCRDWAQMDFRVFAHYLDDPKINDMYAQDPMSDFHQVAADLTGLPRSARFAGDANAKQINLGMVFGMGAGKLAHEMGLEYEVQEGYHGKPYLVPGPKAKEMFAKYHGNIPGVQKLLKKASSVAASRGFVKTIMGRRIRFPRRGESYKAGGLIFQGSAADALKMKIVEVHNYLKGTEARLLLNVHDEQNSSLPKNSPYSEGIREIMECFDGENCDIKFDIPIRSDAGNGPNWWEACK